MHAPLFSPCPFSFSFVFIFSRMLSLAPQMYHKMDIVFEERGREDRWIRRRIQEDTVVNYYIGME